MPYAQNKVIINNGGLQSFSEIANGYFNGVETVMNSGIFLATEMKDNGLLKEPEALDFLKEQEVDCAEVDKACQSFIKVLGKYHAKQMSRNERMRLWVDSRLP